MQCPVMSFAMGLCITCDFGQTVCSHSGLYSFVAKEFAWYVLFWSLLALGWWLIFVYVCRLLDGLLLLNVPCSQEFSGVLRFWA